MTAKEMHTHHRGEAIYTAEVDVHFPQLTVGDTLTFAAHARAPRQLPEGVPKSVFANHLRDVVMAMFDISHTINTRVGNEYVRGVSGGERKRVSRWNLCTRKHTTLLSLLPLSHFLCSCMFSHILTSFIV